MYSINWMACGSVYILMSRTIANHNTAVYTMCPDHFTATHEVKNKLHQAHWDFLFSEIEIKKEYLRLPFKRKKCAYTPKTCSKIVDCIFPMKLVSVGVLEE